MRRFEFAVETDSPERAIGWIRIHDVLRAQWAAMVRTPFTGGTAIGFVWQSRRKHEWKELPQVWRSLAQCWLDQMPQITPEMGHCRFEKTTEAPLLTVSLEGP